MKIIDLRKKITVNYSATGVLILLFAGAIYFNFHQKTTVQEKVDKIKTETSQLQSQTSELQAKSSEAKKYTELWKKLTPQKKNTNGIKMDDTNARMNTLAEKYAISSPSIKVTLPETLKGGIFDRATVNVTSTPATLTFNAVNDAKALMFITEFLDSLPGYNVITHLEIKKGKKYSTEDLIAISSGKATGAISARVEFFWYVYKNKEEEKKPGEAPTSKNKKSATESSAAVETQSTESPNAQPIQ